MTPVALRCSFAFSVWAGLFLLGSTGLMGGANRSPSTSAHSIANPNYQRVRLASGEWEPEAYAFAEGKLLDPAGRDASLTELTFEEMCEILAAGLLKEQYVPTTSVEETELLIVVNWGKTAPYDDGLGGIAVDGMVGTINRVAQIKGAMADQAAATGGAAKANSAQASELASLEGEMSVMMMMQDMADHSRRRGVIHNAQLLGYFPDLSSAFEGYSNYPVSFKRTAFEDLMNELENPRYFVILQAYDFKEWRLEKKRDMLWMTRFSIRAKGRRFDEELSAMSSAASALFGTSSGGLKRQLKPGSFKFGEIEVLQVSEDRKDLNTDDTADTAE